MKKTRIAIFSTVDYDIAKVVETLKKHDFELVTLHHDNNIHLVLAIGGDSAVLGASKFDLPILAWNQGTLGFLTTGNDLDEMLQAYNDDTVLLDRRMRLTVEVNDKKYHALNEVAVIGKETGQLVETDLYIDGLKITTYKGDGLLVATPTGSTAWNLSSGGSLVEQGLPCMLLTPMNPFTMNVRPLIISSNHTVTIEKVDKVAIDGYAKIIPWHGKVTVYNDKKTVTIYRLKEENFFDAIIKKLHWNASIKN